MTMVVLVSSIFCLPPMGKHCHSVIQKLFKIVDSWLGRSKERSLPTHQSSANLANAFSSFYSDKVYAIKDDLIGSRARIDPTSVIGSVHFLDTRTDSDLLTEFSIVGMEELSRAITASPTKSCSLDLIPTSILKKVFFSLFQPSHPSLTFLSRPVCFLMFSNYADKTQLLDKFQIKFFIDLFSSRR